MLLRKLEVEQEVHPQRKVSCDAKALPPFPESVNAGRLPTWDLASTHHRPCPVCSGDIADFVCRRPDRLSVVRCRECDMVYLPEIPNSADMSLFYQSYARFKGFAPRRLSWWQLQMCSLSDLHIGILKATGGLKNAILFEAGCSFGHFLQVARHCGSRVAGIEIDEQACSHLKELGIPNHKSLHECEKADIICAFQLIEHLENPSPVIEQASRALVDDGRLLLALPNGGEVEDVGDGWVGFRVDLEHLNYFSVKTLSLLLRKFSFSVEQYWLHAQPSLARTREVESFRTRVTAGLGRVATRFFMPARNNHICGTGTFVLTVLARKTRQESY